MVLVFAASDKGGTGRSVTSCNMAYWASMCGRKVAYLDFDFGSPTAGTIFEIGKFDRGVSDGSGLHRYLSGGSLDVQRVGIHVTTDRRELKQSCRSPGSLVLLPGDRGGGEFISGITESMVARCAELFAVCDRDFDLSFIDLSAGRSAALTLAVRAIKHPLLADNVFRWLVFHRWTRQHIAATYGLVHGEHGILHLGRDCGFERGELRGSMRFVRTAVPELGTQVLRSAQSAWLQTQLIALDRSAIRYGMGRSVLLGKTPVEPILQCREQVILDEDVAKGVANLETVNAFRELVQRLCDEAEWEGVE
ncbi:SCO2523 family variant P-loop protein [Nocardia sp. NPDC052001]|uniref:SCO2523 family variant P-loop protein n=1 Tax=Nocardia sp. NPDC052001 TaxID=3154853 RepID=UPI003435157C